MNDIDPQRRVAYLGPQGTYSHSALLRYFGPEQAGIPQVSIEEVFACVEKGQAEYAVVPVENSSEGSVTATLDCFNQSPLQICGEIQLRIQQVLMTHPQTGPDGIHRIVSHQQSLGQCRNWLDQHYPGIERIAVSSNAEAARLATQEVGIAAIASKTAAEIYQLKVLAQDIEDSRDNTTRFLVISKKYQAKPGINDKTSLIITTHNVPGALFKVLEPLQRFAVNMSKLESRPSRKEAWSYTFYIDVDGHQQDEHIAAALAALRQPDIGVKILGSYPVSGIVHTEKARDITEPVLLDKKIVIVGLGLIGGSVAKALSDKGLSSQLWAIGRNPDDLQLAQEAGVIAGFSVKAILQGLAGLIKDSCVISDVSSVKQSTVDAAIAAFGKVPANLVPGHPIAGSEKSGFRAARADLFENRRVILTPLPETDHKALELVCALWRELGAEVLEMSVARHDEVLAATSHLPHLLAYALVDTLSQQGTSEEIFRYAAGGFRDFTRIAASDPHMWRDIFLSNAIPLGTILDEFEKDLTRFREALQKGDSEYIMQALKRTKQSRDKFSNQ